MRQFLAALQQLYPTQIWPKPFHALQGLDLVRAGQPINVAAKQVGTSSASLTKLLTAPDPLISILGVQASDVTSIHHESSRRVLSHLLLGRAAEVVFEALYKREMGTSEFKLVDVREGRSDTDYRVVNGSSRPLYRVNIKFFGSLFQRAPELVGLRPEDCFPLATYKIHGALQKQQEEHIPYIFLVVSVPNLSVANVSATLPPEYIGPLALLKVAKKSLGLRSFEERIIDKLQQEAHASFTEVLFAIEKAQWYVLSARRADRLLKDKLFERVFALRIRNFAQQFKRAELDMHFSLRTDLITLDTFFGALRESGQTVMAAKLERGTY